MEHMNVKINTIVIASLLATAPLQVQALTCTTDETVATYHLGIRPTEANVPAILSSELPGGNGTARAVFTNWITLNDQGESVTAELNVDFTDPDNVVLTTNHVTDATILPSSDFATGLIDLEFCKPTTGALPVNGIMSHPLYFNDIGELIGATSVMAHAENNILQAVGNPSSFNEIAKKFNAIDPQGLTGEDYLRNIINSHAGVPITAKAAQEAFTFAAMFSLEEPSKDYVQAINIVDTLIEGNSIYITGPNPSVRVTNSVSDISDESGSLLAGGVFTPAIGQYSQHTLQGKKVFNVVGANPSLTHNSGACVNDEIVFTANFVNHTPLDTRITITKTEFNAEAEDNLNTKIDCVSQYSLKATVTTNRGTEVKSDVTVGNTPERQAALYVDAHLPPQNSKFWLSNEEARALINGGTQTRSYAPDIAAILVRSPTNTNGTLATEIEQHLVNQADNIGGNGELWGTQDPLHYDNDLQGDPAMGLYGEPDGVLAKFKLLPADLQQLYTLIKGLDQTGTVTDGFLVEYVLNNPNLYGGEIGGTPNINHDPTWSTQDPN